MSVSIFRSYFHARCCLSKPQSRLNDAIFAENDTRRIAQHFALHDRDKFINTFSLRVLEKRDIPFDEVVDNLKISLAFNHFVYSTNNYVVCTYHFYKSYILLYNLT